MPDHMLTLEEARELGFDPDPLVFRDCTDRVDRRASSMHTAFYESRFYFVGVTEIEAADGTDMTWLSIRRNDRKAMQDWRHLQAIKNEICGPEREAVQMYPAESRLLDESNQIHLWVYPEGYRLPFGYAERSVVTATELDIQYGHLQNLVPGLMAGKPTQRPFSPSTEAASRSSEEMLKDLANGVVSETLHRRKDQA